MKYPKEADRSLVLYPEHLDEEKVERWLDRTDLRLRPPFVVADRTRLTFDFGEHYRRCTGPLHLHTGLDIGSCRGAALMAPAAMIIRRVGWDRAGGGYIFGEIIDPSTPDAVYLRMFHVAKRNVAAGDVVQTGDVIGRMTKSSGSNSTGLHLHIELLYGDRWPRPWRFAVNLRSLADDTAWGRAIRGY